MGASRFESARTARFAVARVPPPSPYPLPEQVLEAWRGAQDLDPLPWGKRSDHLPEVLIAEMVNGDIRILLALLV